MTFSFIYKIWLSKVKICSGLRVYLFQRRSKMCPLENTKFAEYRSPNISQLYSTCIFSLSVLSLRWLPNMTSRTKFSEHASYVCPIPVVTPTFVLSQTMSITLLIQKIAIEYSLLVHYWAKPANKNKC